MKLIKKFEIPKENRHEVLLFDEPITFTQGQTIRIETERKREKTIVSVCR